MIPMLLKNAKVPPNGQVETLMNLAYPVEGWKKPLALGGKFHSVA
jgi:hypothetical protein